jgi:carbonic anhydrase/acetyltransferase-like protein (isoleucine patch superfamily)
MPVILPVKAVFPTIPTSCFIAPNATIVGDVELGEECSVWFNAVLRGDVCSIKIGHHVNIQDGVCLHGTYQKHNCIIGNYVSIGHNAMVHGCKLEDHVLIGMGAIVMDGVVVNSNCIVAAGAVVLEGSVLESGAIYAGVPAKRVKYFETNNVNSEIERIAHNYSLYASWFKNPL